MRVGVTVRLDRPVTEAAELAARAESLGFGAVWLADHYFHRDAVAALALMATRTTTVALGTAVVSPYLRHPALLASTAATIAEISGGRFILGVGAGGYEFATQLGLPIPRPLGATAETVSIVRQLQAGTADVAGQAFSAVDARLRYQPVASPVYLAARGPKMLQLAGSVGDGVITHGLSSRHLRYVRDHLASDRPELCLMLDVQLDDDRAAAVDALRPRCVTMAGGAYADDLIEVYGLDRDEVGALRRAVRAGDGAGARRLVTDAMVDAFAVAGPDAFVADRLAQLESDGADEVIVSLGEGDLESCTAQLQRLARAVSP
jgi:5,10-methylenetetrahydromethanopterin reductase